MTGPGGVVIIGVGNEFRGDDGAGPEVITRLHGRLPADVRLVLSDGEPTRLLEAWTGASVAIVVDAVAGSAPGALRRLVLGAGVGGGSDAGVASSHGLGLETAIGLAGALGRLPSVLIVHCIEGADFSQRRGLSEAVAAAIGRLADAILADVTASGQ